MFKEFISFISERNHLRNVLRHRALIHNIEDQGSGTAAGTRHDVYEHRTRQGSTSHKSEAPVIAGAVVGGFALALVVFFIILLIRRYRRRRAASLNSPQERPTIPSPNSEYTSEPMIFHPPSQSGSVPLPPPPPQDPFIQPEQRLAHTTPTAGSRPLPPLPNSRVSTENIPAVGGTNIPEAPILTTAQVEMVQRLLDRGVPGDGIATVVRSMASEGAGGSRSPPSNTAGTSRDRDLPPVYDFKD